MARIKLDLNGGMPRVCLVCGSRHARPTRVTIPPSVTPGFGVPLAYRRGYTVLYMTLPLCDAHAGEFFPQVALRYLLILGTVGVPMLFILVGIALQSNLVVGLGIAFAFLPPVAYFLTSSMLNRGRVHPVAYAPDESITFDNVSPKFVRAYNGEEDEDEVLSVEDDRRGRRDEYEDDRPRRRRRDDDEDYPERGRPSSALWWGLGVGGAVLLLVCGGVVAVMLSGLNRPRRGRPLVPGGPVVVKDGRGDRDRGVNKDRDRDGDAKKDGEKDGKKDGDKVPAKVTLAEIEAMKPDPLPIDPTWDEAKMEKAHLSDLAEQDVIVGWGKFGKNGMLGYPIWHPDPNSGNDPIVVKGKRYPRGISFLPRPESFGQVRYPLDGGMKLLKGVVAFNDMPASASVKKTETPAVFTVLGDGRLLWKSRAINEPGDSEELRVSVQGVKALELRVYKPGKKGHVRPVWPEVYVLR